LCATVPLASAANRERRLATLQQEKRAWEQELDGWTHEKDRWSLEVSAQSAHMHPRQMLRELERAMPDDAMVSTDIGNICSVSNSYLRFERPRSMFAAMSFGNCGYAFPTIIGAKVGAPDRSAIAYVGDGAWGMSFGELQTCVRENIPVPAVVFNNGQWGAEKKNPVDFYAKRFIGVNLDRQPSWAGVARAMGAQGVRIEKLSDVGPALRDAAAAQREGKTTVLELMVTRELGDPFRRDALALPVRHLAKYKATAAQ
jgi:sulfoacetaldehyde acetyltransferase